VGTRAKEYGKERAAEPAGARRPGSRETEETERRILELESEKERLEQQIAAAFSKGDHQEGRRLSGNLERVAKRIEKLYAEWG
jgi:Tfp pilus assembly protein FimV